MTEDGRGEHLEAMYSKWPFFKVTMDMIAMVLAKGDESTVSLYEAKLVPQELYPVGNALRGSFATARTTVLSIVGSTSVLGSGAKLATPSATRVYILYTHKCKKACICVSAMKCIPVRIPVEMLHVARVTGGGVSVPHSP